MLLFVISVKAHGLNTDISYNKHDIKISYSDGLTLGGASFWGMGLSDAITGTKRTGEQSTGVLGVGYRYTLNKRFKLGFDLGLAKVTSKVTSSHDKTPSIKEKELNFLILPTTEFIYLHKRFLHLYGSASVGVDLTRHYEKGLTEKGKELAQKTSKYETGFAYQVNPIGLRLGNNRIGGFAEVGLGYKGFISVGMILSF